MAIAQKQVKGRIVLPEQLLNQLEKVARFIERQVKKPVVTYYDGGNLKLEINAKYAGLVKFFRKVYKNTIAEMDSKAGVKVKYNRHDQVEVMGFEVTNAAKNVPHIFEVILERKGDAYHIYACASFF